MLPQVLAIPSTVQMAMMLPITEALATTEDPAKTGTTAAMAAMAAMAATAATAAMVDQFTFPVQLFLLELCSQLALMEVVAAMVATVATGAVQEMAEARSRPAVTVAPAEMPAI